MSTQKLASLALVALLPLTACAAPDSNAVDDPGRDGFDISSIEKDDAVAALVPRELASRGTLRNAAATDYAPAEYRKEDGQTPTGYDIDLAKALAKVMGLKGATTTHAPFDSLIPQVGSKFDLSLSSFSITAEREAEVNMISYVKVGSAFATAKKNAQIFDPANPCGKTIGVQKGTFQYEYVAKLSNKCKAESKAPITVKPHDVQTEITPKVASGQYDATFADSTVVGYSIRKTRGALTQVGDTIESAPQGVVVAKADRQLGLAVQAAMQKLMRTGQLKKILGHYGAADAALEEAELNPQVGK